MSAALLPLIVALLAPPPDAEAAPSASGEEVEVIEVRARRLRRDARDATLAVDALRPADDPRPLTDLGALLDRAPGLRILRGGDAGGRQTVQLRGAAGHQVAVLLDGVPLGGGRGGAVDLGALPPAMLERVEVVRGAAGAAYGSGAQGGALHLRTRRFDDAVADVRLRGGSFGLLQADAAAGVGGRGADGLLMLGASRAAGDFDYTDAQGRPGVRLNNDHRRLSGLARGRLETGGVEVSALGFGLAEARGEPGVDQFPDPDARSERGQWLASAAAEGDGLDGRLVWRAQGWWLGRRGALTAAGSRADDRWTSREDAAGLRAMGDWHGFEWHRPSLAVEGRIEAVEVGDALNPAADVDATRLGGAATLAWEVEPCHAFRVVPLVRLDALQGRDAMWVPKLGAAWHVIDGPGAMDGIDDFSVTLRANVGSLFRDPSFDELYFRAPGVEGDPDLRPEEGWGADAGVTLDVSLGMASMTLDAMLFAQRFDRIILFVPVDAYTLRAVDDFAAAVDGAEVALRLAVGPVALEGTWLWQDARFTSAPAAPLPDRPGHRLMALLRATLGPIEPFAVARWHGEVSVDRFGSRTRPGYALLDAGLAARLPAGFDVAAELRNALDGQAFDLLQRPLPGRSVIVEIGWRGP